MRILKRMPLWQQRLKTLRCDKRYKRVLGREKFVCPLLIPSLPLTSHIADRCALYEMFTQIKMQ